MRPCWPRDRRDASPRAIMAARRRWMAEESRAERFDGGARPGRLARGLRVLRTDPATFLSRVRKLLRRRGGRYRKRWSMSLAAWLVRHQDTIVFEKCRWMGVPMLKNPLDAWICQELLFEVR